MKTRIRFTKTGSVKFIGHLDLMRFFQKAIRRAKLDVSYSKGYSPHQLMSFASPLGLGLTTDGDYLDVEFNSLPDMPVKELIAHLNEVMTEEIFVTDILFLPDDSKTSMALLEAADYRIDWKDGYRKPENCRIKFEKYLSRDEIQIKKKTKKSEKMIDVKPYILKHGYELKEFSEQTGSIYPQLHHEYESEEPIYLQLTSGSSVNIKPNLIIEDFLAFCGLEPNPYSYQIHRLEMYFHTANCAGASQLA